MAGCCGSNRPTIPTSLLLVLALSLAACGQTGVRPLSRTRVANLAAPARIVVYDFTMDDAVVKEYQGILRQQPAKKNPAQRESEIRRHASESFAVELVDGLRGLGFTVARVARGTPPGARELLIDGKFLTVDQGNPLRRLVIGFGAGASKVETRVEVYHAIEGLKIIEFTTRSDSGKLPGAATTVPASAAIQGGVTVALVAGGAVGTGYEAYRTDVAQMARFSAEQSVRYLSEFFAEQGWIRSDQVKKARIVY